MIDMTDLFAKIVEAFQFLESRRHFGKIRIEF